SMRPSGRNAMRQGRSKLATFVMLKGRLGSDFCSPALVCACAAFVSSATRRTAMASFVIRTFPCVRVIRTIVILQSHPPRSPFLRKGEETQEPPVRRNRETPAALAWPRRAEQPPRRRTLGLNLPEMLRCNALVFTLYSRNIMRIVAMHHAPPARRR